MLIFAPDKSLAREDDRKQRIVGTPDERSRVRQVVTGYTVHSGSNEKFSGGWDRVFGKKKPTTSKSGKAAKKSPAKTKKK